MPEYDESGFKFYLEDERSFRFEELESYNKPPDESGVLESYKRRLADSGVKEMDFAWIDEEGTLKLLEAESRGFFRTFFKRFVKKYGIEDCTDEKQQGIIEKCVRDAFIDYLAAKATDSLLMLAATWIPTDYGELINNEMPAVFGSQSELPRISVNFFLVGAGIGESMAYKKELSQKLSGKLRLLDTENGIAVYGNAEKAQEKLGIRIE